ncbi:MAG: fumarylacetoacetate hydrolase family protein [Actinomycetota bacterium]|nr:fumarylacetoacetate hydrolase family protein [Actinomycetota bacterium]
MRLSLFDDHRLGVWGSEGTIVDITDLLAEHVRPADRMNALIERWDELVPTVAEAAGTVGVALGAVTLRAPQPRPTKIVGAPANHAGHQTEMIRQGGFDAAPATIEKYAGFLKAPSSIIGPDAAIVLPYPDRRVDHEAELGVVLGRRARHGSRRDALAFVFGYVPLLDITMRGDEDRPFRKSFDTFTPIGPAIVTADEVPDPSTLELRLHVNDELRQHGCVAELIYDVARLIEVYSAAMTLEAGDIIASGTIDGVSRLEHGDRVALSITGLPPLEIGVVAAGQPQRT